MTKRLLVLITICCMGVVLASCGDDDTADPGDAVTISDVWARSTALTAENGAAYMTIESSEDDELVSAKAPTSIAATTELHETTDAAAGDSMDGAADDSMDDTTTDDGGTDDTMDDSTSTTGDGGMDDGGMMGMREVDSIAITADDPVTLKPGGYHVMLLELAAPLEAGSSFDLELQFAKAGKKTVTVAVRDDAP